MTNNTPGLIDPEQLLGLEERKDLGVVVNLASKESEAEQAAEKKIADLQLPFELSIKLTSEQRIRLTRLCKDFDTTENEFISNLIIKELESRIGRASITGPSKLHGQPIKGTGTVTGPSNSAHIWRAFE